MFVMTLPFSDARIVASFPRASLEFFLEGHRLAFSFFGGVPARIVYDNLKSAVIKVGRGRRRDLNTTFEQFCEHLFRRIEVQTHNVGHLVDEVLVADELEGLDQMGLEVVPVPDAAYAGFRKTLRLSTRAAPARPAGARVWQKSA